MLTAADVSVVVPVYNGERFILDALDSIVGQTRPPGEVVVVDDGSTDATEALVRSTAGVRCLGLSPNQGQAAALNHGVARTRGRLLAFLDADDVWEPNKLEAQIAWLNRNPNLEAVFGWTRECEWESDDRRDEEHEPQVAHLPSALLIHRRALDRVGPFATRWRVGSVVEWFARALDASLKFAVLDQVVYRRRLHARNLGRTATSGVSDYLSVVRATVARRRRERTTE